MKAKRRPTKGLSLIENLISMSLFLLLLLGALEIFGVSRAFFHRLKTDQEGRLDSRAALDKIKTDLADCGLGLIGLPHHGTIAALEAEDNTLTIRKAERVFSLTVPLTAGQTLLTLPEAEDPKKGQEICFFDEEKGETRTVAATDGDSLLLSVGLDNSYESNSSVVLVSKISFYLDKKVLRRKLNSSPAQPLCENVQSFECAYDPAANIITLCLRKMSETERSYGISVFPKNTGLAALY